MFSASPASKSRFAPRGTHSCFSLPCQPAHAHTSTPARNLLEKGHYGYEQQLLGPNAQAGAVAVDSLARSL